MAGRYLRDTSAMGGRCRADYARVGRASSLPPAGSLPELGRNSPGPEDLEGPGGGWASSGSREGVASQLKPPRPDPGRAVSLYETFLAGCYEKAEELDDSSGNFGMFVVRLYRDWIKARQAASADGDETARL